MKGRDPLFAGRSAPPAPPDLRRRIRAAIASAPRADDRSLPSAWHLLWALLVFFSLLAHLALDLSHRVDAPLFADPRGVPSEGGAE